MHKTEERAHAQMLVEAIAVVKHSQPHQRTVKIVEFAAHAEITVGADRPSHP